MPSVSEDELRRRLAEGSRNLDDHVELADWLAHAGRIDESVEVLENALLLPLTTFDRARSATELGWRLYDCVAEGTLRAQALAQDAIAGLAGEPDIPPALAVRGAAQSLLAHCLAWTDREAGARQARWAVEALESAGRAGPVFPWMRWVPFDAARAHILLEEGDKAVACCRPFLSGDLCEGERLAAVTVLGDALRLAGRLTEAEAVVEEAFELARGRADPLPGLHHLLGLIQRAAGRARDACESFERVLAALEAPGARRYAPEFYQAAYGNLAGSYYELGEYDRAADRFRLCLAQYPDVEQGRVLT